MSVNTDRAIAMVRCGIITERRSCLTKCAFALRNHALNAAKRVTEKTGRKAVTYKCTFCAHWHVTKVKHGDES